MNSVSSARGNTVFGGSPQSASGARQYYLYDGFDVAVVVARIGGSWSVRQRMMSGGIDRPLVTRFTPTGLAAKNLAFVADRQGTTLAAVGSDGQRDQTVAYFGRNPFGALDGASGAGTSSNAETGFTGASTPNQTGGFTYLRNRWYDPQTGRFLTQDPIGLAGGVNLYAYAGNNPVAYTDPFGLCPPDDTSPCSASDYWAIRSATGQGNRVVNNVMGTLASCGESWACQGVLALGGVASAGVRTLAVRGAAAAAEAGGEVTSGAVKAMQSQLEGAGRKSVEKTIRTLTRRVADHEARMAEYRAAGGNVSSMEREVNAFRETIEAAKKVLEVNK